MVLQKSLKNRNDLGFRNDLWCNDLWVSTVYTIYILNIFIKIVVLTECRFYR